ncbi:5-methylcytosine-specific restriction endonuclease system specificity protein McrC [Hymenobacter fastidiosus]|uniref:5-methylcytosine-specific restriction endonuclease system specificity protein McrC n=1 Tax=Hymenobacter fastidiosus TaxID=486264 RepID=A0ABP7RVS2_9BACT
MVPIQNLYYLLCYAWNRLPEPDALLTTEATAFHRPLELLAHVLATGTRRLLRQGLENAYSERQEDLGELRGRLLLAPSLSRDLLRRGRAVCRYDELGPATPFNRLLLGTLLHLGAVRRLPAPLRHDIRILRRRFPATVEPTPLSLSALRMVRRQRRSGLEAFLLNVVELIHRSALPEATATGRARFRDFRRDERLMAQLFEAFVRNFYRLEQHRFRVRSETIAWQAAADSAADLALLPAMITDTTLEAPDRKIILDTKYYAAALRPRYDQQKLISPHLYQLYAYLQNQPVAPGQALEGILLYPAAAQAVDLRYTLGGHPVRIVTIDLAQPWPAIAADLLGLVE